MPVYIYSTNGTYWIVFFFVITIDDFCIALFSGLQTQTHCTLQHSPTCVSIQQDVNHRPLAPVVGVTVIISESSCVTVGTVLFQCCITNPYQWPVIQTTAGLLQDPTDPALPDMIVRFCVFTFWLFRSVGQNVLSLFVCLFVCLFVPLKQSVYKDGGRKGEDFQLLFCLGV